MMYIIGRKSEQELLEECLASRRPEFLAIYGRRRVGKTYLVKEFFDNSFSFYTTGVKGIHTKQQLKLFKEALVKYGDQSNAIPKDWFEAFSRLEKILESKEVKRDYKSGKKVVFLDELPWMATAKSDFKSALDYFWNSWGSSQQDLLLIVCGSATSWIINNIVKDTGGFYNRITRQMHLMPFQLKECEKLFEANGLRLSKRQIVESYMIFGGIPYYLNYLKLQYSLAQNVEMLFFQENSPLRNEFGQLFASLFQRADKYVDIIKVLVKGKAGITRNDLLESGKTVTGKDLTKCLEELEQCGFIRKYHDFSKKEQGCFYQLTDPLTLFHLTFLETNKIDSWIHFINTPAYYSWCGLAFEKVCLLHIEQIKKKLGISGMTTQVFSWKSKMACPGVQIDLLIDRKDDVVTVCEMKYTLEEYAIDSAYENELERKLNVFREETKTKKALYLTMISFAGLRKNECSEKVVQVLTGDDLFEE